MKKITFLFTTLFVVGVAQAAESFKFSDSKFLGTNFNNAEPIAFVERGITFYVFMNGEFDFNTEPSNSSVVYRKGRRSVNVRFGTGNFGGTRIEHDDFGRIRRVGNVFINYDFQNRIKRIGSVNMAYNRFALMQVGGLRLIYNRFGDVVDAIGSVNNQWNTQYGPYCNSNNSDGGYYNNNFGNGALGNDNYYNNNSNQYQSPNDNDNDDDGYLYKKGNDSKEKDKKSKDNPAMNQNSGGRR